MTTTENVEFVLTVTQSSSDPVGHRTVNTEANIN